jgi:hypothetical protein
MLPFLMVLGVTSICLAPAPAYAETAQNDPRQQAYDAGYRDGANDKHQDRSMNPKPGDLRGNNLEAYKKGYQDGYRNAGQGDYGGYQSGAGNANAPRDNNQQAYQAGYESGVSDKRQKKPLNPKTDKWNGEALEAYQKAYVIGYRSTE